LGQAKSTRSHLLGKIPNLQHLCAAAFAGQFLEARISAGSANWHGSCNTKSHERDGPARLFDERMNMQNYNSLVSRIAASAAAFSISMFLIAVSFAPPGSVVISTGLVA
jgi:hypothetical protein